MVTLLELKNRKAMLRGCMDIEQVADGKVSEDTLEKYQIVLGQLGGAEDKLLKSTDHCSRCRWLNERNN